MAGEMSLSKPFLKETKTNSLFCLRSDPRAKRKTVLKVKCFKEASLIGSNGAFVSWCKTRERFQEGNPLWPLGLSLWKLSRRRVKFSSLLILMSEFPSLSAMETCNHQWCWAVTSCPEKGT